MTTQEVADRLVGLCREGKFEQVYQELYTTDALSIEPEGTPFGTVRGMEEFKKKGEQWQAMVKEMHSSEVSDPIVAENFFSCSMKTKVTMNGASDPVDMDEICVYNVVNGKVVSEQFFYTPQPEFA